MDLGTNLKNLRREKHLTQEDLADILGVSPQTVSKWENGLSAPDISLLPALADYYGISIDSLLLHEAGPFKNEMRAFADGIKAQMKAGQTEAAYASLRGSVGKWALSASMNHLMSWAAYRLSGEKDGEERRSLLEEAVTYADRAVRLDGGETSVTAQARMTKCRCLLDLGQKKEAVRIAGALPSMYSSRERVLAKITEGAEQQAYVKTALQYLEELKEEMQQLQRT